MSDTFKTFLVGMPGCGKSTVGRALGRQLGLLCIDLDVEIEKYIGSSIKAYFLEKGEQEFRKIESFVLKSVVLKPDSFVVATGGGVVLDQGNRDLLREERVIYLLSKPDDLVKRLNNDNVRPLMQSVDLRKTLNDLYEKRHPLYQDVADFVIPTAGKTAAKIADEIAEILC